MHLRNRIGPLLVILGMTVLVWPALDANAQYSLGATVVGAGATEASGGNYSLRGTVGEPVIGHTGGAVELKQGFWWACGGLLAGVVLYADIKVLLEGPYAGGGLMSSALNPAHLPLTQPYGDTHFSQTPEFYPGSDAVASIPTGAVDWVVVELRTSTAATDSVTSSAGFVMTDGAIRDPSGTGMLAFKGISAGDYRLVVRHRNHLPVMSSALYAVGVSPALYDFTDALAKAYKPGSIDPIAALGDGRFALGSSDFNCDGQITAPDFNSYLSNTVAGTTGYSHADFNLDGQVTAPDFNLFFANTTTGAAAQVPEN
jgi:hypothetical protein